MPDSPSKNLSNSFRGTSLSTLEPIEAIAAQNFAKIETQTMEIYGAVTAGDLSFTKTSSSTCSKIVLENGTGSTDEKLNTLTVNSITLSGVELCIENYTLLTGEIKNAAGSVTVSKIATSSEFSVSDSSSNLVLSGTATASADSVFSVSSGTVYGGYKTSSTTKTFNYDASATKASAMTVASGATLKAESVNDIDAIVVDGTFTVDKGKTATIETMTVLGTVDVFEGSDTETAGSLTIADGKVLYIGTDSETITGAATVFNGPVAFAGKAVVIVAAGSAVDEDALEDFGEASTAYYVQGSLWITAYAVGSFTTTTIADQYYSIATYDKPTPKDAYFSGWYNADGKGAATTVSITTTYQYIGADGFERVDAYVVTEIYKIIVKADEGISDIYLNGDKMLYGLIQDSTDTSVTYYGYYSTVEAGTYEVTYTLKNGYSGTAVLKDSDGKTLDGNKFTVSGNADNSRWINKTYQLSGIEKSGYVDPVEPEEKDNSLTVTDYLLIVLVILVVVLAVIVAMRLMWS